MSDEALRTFGYMASRLVSISSKGLEKPLIKLTSLVSKGMAVSLGHRGFCVLFCVLPFQSTIELPRSKTNNVVFKQVLNKPDCSQEDG